MGWAAAAVGIFTWGAGMLGASEQKDVDQQTVELQYRDNLEKIRRRSFTQEKTKGKAKAFSENAGVLHSGGSTAQGYMDTLAGEFRSELNWMKDYAKMAKKLGMKKASVDYDTNRMKAWESGLSAASNVMSMG